MEHLIGAVEKAVKERNWYAALSLALTLPDICAKMESPSQGSAKRYIAWANAYFTPKYTHEIGPDREKHIFLSGSDLYALRCAVLHEGSDDIVMQRARESLDRFHIIAPPKTGSVHCNQLGTILQVQVDILCRDICVSVRQWLDGIDAQGEVQSRIANLMKIHQFKAGGRIPF